MRGLHVSKLLSTLVIVKPGDVVNQGETVSGREIMLFDLRGMSYVFASEFFFVWELKFVDRVV